jgi:hypothetical protein
MSVDYYVTSLKITGKNSKITSQFAGKGVLFKVFLGFSAVQPYASRFVSSEQ